MLGGLDSKEIINYILIILYFYIYYFIYYCLGRIFNNG